MFRDNTRRMTAAEYAAHAGRVLPNTADTSKPPFALPPATKGLYALGRLKTGEMNKTEAAYDQHLWQRFFAKEILWHKFEAVKLRLADNTFYTCDFAVLTADLALEMHEVKGYWQDDARVKIKVAASLYPFRFIAVTPRAKKNGGGYDVEQF
jgi:hypothetical protein